MKPYADLGLPRYIEFKCEIRGQFMHRKLFVQEDELLLRLVVEHGLIRWCDIAPHFQERSGKQCSERQGNIVVEDSELNNVPGLTQILLRYQHYLCPGIAKDPWTREEDIAILSAHDMIGSRWKEM